MQKNKQKLRILDNGMISITFTDDRRSREKRKNAKK